MPRNKRGDEKRGDIFYRWPEDIVLVGHDTDDRWDHPLYDPRVHDGADPMLAADIAALGGIKTAVTVVEDGVLESGEPRVICKVGRGRILAARSLNETRENMGLPKEFRVPCVYDRKGTEKSMMAHLISENEQRRGDSLERKIQKLERFLQAGGTPEEAAIHFRRTDVTIRQWIKFMGVARQWQQTVYTGGGSMADVLRLLSDGKGNLVDHGQQVKLFKQCEERARQAKQQASSPTSEAGPEQGNDKATDDKPPKRKQKLTDKLPTGRPSGPSRKVVEKVLVALQQESCTFEIHEEFLRALRWVSGKIDATEAGVDAILAQSKKKSKSKKPDKPANRSRRKLSVTDDSLAAVTNVLDHEGMSSSEILRALPAELGLDVVALRKHLSVLVEQGTVAFEGEKRARKYFLA